MQVTLIGTRHREVGNCNSQALYEILLALNPEIIFEEMPLKDFDDYYVYKKRSKLESIAILRYKQSKSVIQVPIDLENIPENEFLYAYETIYKTVYNLTDQNGLDFRNLTKQFNQQTSQHGFEYLNSSHFSNACVQANEIIENALNTINSNVLFQALALWKKINAEREAQMVQSIYAYYEISKFENAVFLIGAIHKKSIIDEISKIEKKLKFNLIWNF